MKPEFKPGLRMRNGGSNEMYAQNNIVRYDVPARGNLPPVKIHVYDDGKLKPEIMKAAEQEHGAKFGESTLRCH